MSDLELMRDRVNFLIDKTSRSQEIAKELKGKIDEQIANVMMTFPDYGDQEILAWLQGVCDGIQVADKGEWD